MCDFFFHIMANFTICKCFEKVFIPANRGHITRILLQLFRSHSLPGYGLCMVFTMFLQSLANLSSCENRPDYHDCVWLFTVLAWILFFRSSLSVCDLILSHNSPVVFITAYIKVEKVEITSWVSQVTTQIWINS